MTRITRPDQRVDRFAHRTTPPALVVRGNGRRDWHLCGDGQAVAGEPDDLLWVVRQQPHAAKPEIDENLGADAVGAKVHWKAKGEVGVYGVEPGLLQLVCLELVEQPDASS